MSASEGTVLEEGLECGETSDSDEESIAHALLALLTRSRTRSCTTFRARVATGGCANFDSASTLLVKRGNGGAAMLRLATLGTYL